jgi:4-hydroxy-3-methylbut-2-enyl diphosphate reductase
MFRSNSCVGITAGASTPNNIIEEVQEHVRTEL